MCEDFGFGGDERMIGDCMDDWALSNPFAYGNAEAEDEADYSDDDYSDYADESMDGDASSALASCGWGTDEDYGYGGDDY